MKTLINTLTLILCACTIHAQTDCQPYIPITKGSKWELTNYSKKGKKTGRAAYELIDKVTNGDQITFTMNIIAYDKKDKEIFNNTSTATCEEGHFKFDMSYKMDGSTMEAYEDMDLAIDASDFEIPTFDQAVGTSLEDGKMTIEIGQVGIKMKVSITDRKIEAKEEVTTPAGTFNCMVLTHKIKTKLVINIKGSAKEWYAKDIGLVKTESYNKKGKLTGSSVLTKLDLK